MPDLMAANQAGFLAHPEIKVKMLLGNCQDADSSFRLAQVVVDADEGLHCRLWAALVFQLLVVQGFGKRMALLCQGAQGPVRFRLELGKGTASPIAALCTISGH